MISPLKCSLLNILSNETVSMSYPFSFLRYQKNVLLTSNLDNWWCHKLKIYLESSSKAMTDREKLRGSWKCKHLSIKNENSFLGEKSS